MKILLLNQVFYPDVVATAQYLNELAAALAERGHEVTVVSSRRAYDHPEKIFPARETWRGVTILRSFSTRLGKGAKWRRAVDFASFLCFACVRLLCLRRHDVVVALTTPPLISFIGAVRARLWQARFCYWVMDFNPDEAIAAGWLRADSFAARFLERLSRFSLRSADGIVALDRFMRDRIVAKGIPSEKVAVIPPWSLDAHVAFDAAGRDAFRAKYGLTGKFVVMYSGNHSPVHPLATLLQAADRLREEKEIVFCFVGGGSEFARVKQWAADSKHPQVVCLPYQPIEMLSGSLSAADAHVVVMGNAMLGLVHPCKIYNILSVGAPVIYIGPESSHVTEILCRLKQPPLYRSVRHGDAEALAAQIRSLKVESNSCERTPPREVEAYYSQKVLLPKLLSLVEGSIPKPDPAGVPVAIANHESRSET